MLSRRPTRGDCAASSRTLPPRSRAVAVKDGSLSSRDRAAWMSSAGTEGGQRQARAVAGDAGGIVRLVAAMGHHQQRASGSQRLHHRAVAAMGHHHRRLGHHLGVGRAIENGDVAGQAREVRADQRAAEGHDGAHRQAAQRLHHPLHGSGVILERGAEGHQHEGALIFRREGRNEGLRPRWVGQDGAHIMQPLRHRVGREIECAAGGQQQGAPGVVLLRQRRERRKPEALAGAIEGGQAAGVECLADFRADGLVLGGLLGGARAHQARPHGRHARGREQIDVHAQQNHVLPQRLAAELHAEQHLVRHHEVGGLTGEFGRDVLGKGEGRARQLGIEHGFDALEGRGRRPIVEMVELPGPGNLGGRARPGGEAGTGGEGFHPIAGIAHQPHAVPPLHQPAGQLNEWRNGAATLKGGDQK